MEPNALQTSNTPSSSDATTSTKSPGSGTFLADSVDEWLSIIDVSDFIKKYPWVVSKAQKIGDRQSLGSIQPGITDSISAFSVFDCNSVVDDSIINHTTEVGLVVLDLSDTNLGDTKGSVSESRRRTCSTIGCLGATESKISFYMLAYASGALVVAAAFVIMLCVAYSNFFEVTDNLKNLVRMHNCLFSHCAGRCAQTACSQLSCANCMRTVCWTLCKLHLLS